jgi:glycosyltransferase involved in cell wall biosynthesis
MNIVAIIACRNEEAYLNNCLTYLMANDVKFAIIDDGSTDRTSDIVRQSKFARGLVYYEKRPFEETYQWMKLLIRKMEISESIDADWVIHHDADEVMHSDRKDESLSHAIRRIASTGASAINLDEFVFLPIDHDYLSDSRDPQPLRHYYFFEPHPIRLIRIWKTGIGLSMVDSGGHHLTGYPTLAHEHLVLRHYPFRSQAHALTKYPSRRFAPDELARGWHANRHDYPAERFWFPSRDKLKMLDDPSSRIFDKSDPYRVHFWDQKNP